MATQEDEYDIPCMTTIKEEPTETHIYAAADDDPEEEPPHIDVKPVAKKATTKKSAPARKSKPSPKRKIHTNLLRNNAGELRALTRAPNDMANMVPMSNLLNGMAYCLDLVDKYREEHTTTSDKKFTVATSEFSITREALSCLRWKITAAMESCINISSTENQISTLHTYDNACKTIATLVASHSIPMKVETFLLELHTIIQNPDAANRCGLMMPDAFRLNLNVPQRLSMLKMAFLTYVNSMYGKKPVAFPTAIVLHEWLTNIEKSNKEAQVGRKTPLDTTFATCISIVKNNAYYPEVVDLFNFHIFRHLAATWYESRALDSRLVAANQSAEDVEKRTRSRLPPDVNSIEVRMKKNPETVILELLERIDYDSLSDADASPAGKQALMAFREITQKYDPSEPLTLLNALVANIKPVTADTILKISRAYMAFKEVRETDQAGILGPVFALNAILCLPIYILAERPRKRIVTVPE
jgi:hypothetical protein